nr:WD repeat-containing protein 7 [Ipomoea batatas]
MKCRSIACIWSGSPPAHKVTAVAVLNRPPTLYTGGSDGSIIWWNLYSSTQSTQEIKPISMLCGHAAPIVDLGICCPTAVSGDGIVDEPNDVVPNSNSSNCGALISACTDGILCVWSRASGHCRRRRKLPPWAGTPSILRTFPENLRYVCIACCSVDSVHLHEHQSVDVGAEGLVDTESQHPKSTKCAIVIVDSYTLSILQTVFHGPLSMGPLKSMGIVSSVGDIFTQSVMMVDFYGKVQCIPILKDCVSSMENVTGRQSNSSNLGNIDWEDGMRDRGLLVSFINCGQVLGFLYKTCCIFRLLEDGSRVGEISFLDDPLCLQGSYIVGGMFLRDDNAEMGLDSGISYNLFAVWNNRGSTVIYRVLYSSNVFKYEPLSTISAGSLSSDVRLSLSFAQLNNFLIRVESICCHKEEPLLWMPHVTIWSLPEQFGNNGRLFQDCDMIGEGNYFDDWVLNLTSSKPEVVRQDVGMKTKATEHKVSNSHKYDSYNREELVSSSMVISEDYYIPLAIVYGFYNGDIKVMRFDMFFEELDFHSLSPHHNTHTTEQYLAGHEGAVLCLAAHRLKRSAEGKSSYILLSGSLDCTVRVWDLDSSNPLIVMHQHVAPVRQIILPPPQTHHPWNNCFLSVGEDSCVALVSLDTMRVERMFPGHPFYPAKVVWDSTRGYIACLCTNQIGKYDRVDVLYIWDVKTGARERVLRGAAAHSMFEHFCVGINKNLPSGSVIYGNTSASSMIFPVIEGTKHSQSHLQTLSKATSSKISSAPTSTNHSITSYTNGGNAAGSISSVFSSLLCKNQPVKSFCPFPGIAALSFDLTALMSLCLRPEPRRGESGSPDNNQSKEAPDKKKSKDIRIENHTHSTDNKQSIHRKDLPSQQHVIEDNNVEGTTTDAAQYHEWIISLERCLLQFSLAILHMWNVDYDLDKLLVTEMKLKRPTNFLVASGLLGDRGSLTLTFPDATATLELWKSSSEYCAMRSLTMVSLAQHIISLSHTYSAASSALSAFYMRNLTEKIPDIKPPFLQLLVSFWQDDIEHVKMAARSLFHFAASRAIPTPLCSDKTTHCEAFMDYSNGLLERENYNSVTTDKPGDCTRTERHDWIETDSGDKESEILSWLESVEMQDWISCVGGTGQDAMTSHIIVAAALAVWYPSLVKPKLAMLAVHPLMKLVMAMNEKYSSTAAEILAEGMERTWKACIGSEIPRLIGDIFFQIECVSGASANASMKKSSLSVKIHETLAGILLPSLAMADILGFLNVIESQVWSTASDSPVHVVSVMTLIRVARGSPRNLVQYLDKVVTFILQTMDPGNSVMRRSCMKSSMAALKEIVRIFPMVALNESLTRLAIGDAIGEINNTSIHVYDMQSITKIKILDASGPPGLPSLLGGSSEMAVNTAISALSFSPDGEGLLAFSENGLMIRWWSLGSVWWEKLSRNLVPVQCTKLIFVPPWEGFSPNSSRISIMAPALSKDGQSASKASSKASTEMDRLKLLLHNLDLSYRLEWVGERNVKLTQHGRELGVFQLQV